MPENKLNIIHLEDDLLFAELTQGQLEAAGYECRITVVENRNDFVQALDEQTFSLILADYTLPSFNGVEALRIAQLKCPHVPYLFLTGTLGEELAIDSLHQGATDYILKQRMERLIPSVNRAMQIVEERQKRIDAEQVIRESEIRLRTVIDSLPHLIHVKDEKGIFILANKTCAEAFGFTPKELIGKTIYDVCKSPQEAMKYHQDDLEVIQGNVTKFNIMEPFTDQDGIVGLHQTTKVPFTTLTSIKSVLGISIDVTDQLETENQLKESQERLNLALSSTQMGTWDWDIPHDYINWDDVNHNLFGMKPDSFLGTYADFEAMLHQDDREIMKQQCNECINKNKELKIEYRTVWKDQSIHWISTRGKVHFDDQGIPIRMIGVNWDITEYKKNEDKIKQLATAVEQSPVSVMITDPEGLIQYVNPVFTSITGYAHYEVINQKTNIIKSGYHDKNYYKDLWATIKSGQPWRGTFCNKKKDGTLFWESATISPVKDQDGNIINYISVKEDITERKQLEEAYQVLVNQSIQGLFIVQDNKIVFANERFAEICGYTLDELYAMDQNDLFQTVHPEDREIIADRNVKRLRGEDLPPSFEFRNLSKNGNVTWIQAYSSLISYRGKPAIQTAVIDITENRQLSEQLNQAQKMESIGQLAGGVAHDFNNILMSIKMNTEFALNEVEQGTQIHEDLNEIFTGAERASSLTRQLLAFSRKQVIEPQVINLNDITQNTEKMLRRLIGEDIDLLTSLAPELGNIKADPGQIEQVIMNLVVNARDAIQGHGKITIETQNVNLDENYSKKHIEIEPGSYVMLAVSDTGTGMSKEVQQKLFEPFFTTKDKGKGTGLGLSTVYGIVKQSGGSIYVYSELNVGTTFHVYLPCINKELEDNETYALNESLDGSQSILVVEDDEGVKKVVSRILKEHGYQITLAQNGVEALELCKNNQTDFDLLLTDVIMPEMNGKELADLLQIKYPNLKVLYMSGYTDNAIAHHGVLDEGLELVQKPVSTKELLKKVKQVINK